MSSDSDQKAAREFNEVLRDTVSSPIKRRKIKESIDKSVNDLSFLHPKLQLKKTDPSYTYRYVFARKFWKQETCGERSIDNSNLDELEKKLKKELKQKENMFVKDTEKFEYSGDSRFQHKTERPTKVVACVVLKGENKIFVKPLSGDDELQVDEGEISCSYNLVYPGDEVEVSVYSGQKSFGRDLKILKCNYEIPKSHITDFIEELKRNLPSEDSNALSFFDSWFTRCKGVWDYLLRDKEPVPEDILSIIKISATLMWKLSRGNDEFCKEFLEVFSCSLFFVNVLPKFIKESIHDSKSTEVGDLETLLLLMVELSPYSGKKIFEIAHCLVDALIDNPEQGKEALAHEKYHWGTQLLANLGEKLAKSVPGCQEFDTTHCSWRDAQTILTKKEIFSTHDISHLSPIRTDEPYDSEEQYLETNYRLLREECYRNLYTGIQKFCENPEKYDPKKVKIYRVTLDSIFPTDSPVSIVLKYEGLHELEEDTSQVNRDLLYGNLMCISLDKTFKTPVWATVESPPLREDSNVRYNIVNIKLFSERNDIEDGKILLKLHELTQKGDHALMAESPSFFQAFGPSMERLQEVGKQYALPFKDEIIFCKKSKPPEYTSDKRQECNWGIIFEESSVRKDHMKLQSSPIETYRYLRERKIPTQLDDTQLQAIQVFLENRVSLIQGPPGTGKSFLGVKILRLMLSMKIHKRYDGPILVMTYKNAALDHFLKECLEYWPRILRIGRSCGDSLEAINLNHVRRNEAMSSELSRLYKEVMQDIRDSRSKLKAAFENLKRFSLKSFIQGAKRCHIQSLLVESPDPISNSKRDKSDIENLLSEWDEESGFEGCSQDLKEMIKDALKKWLPDKKPREIYKSYSKSKNELRVHVTKSEATGVTVDEDNEEESRDVRVIMDERLQDADERDDEISKMGDNHDAVDDDIDFPVMVDCNAKIEFERADITIDRTINLWKLEPEQRVDFVYALQYKVLGKCIGELTAAAQEYERNRRKRQGIMDSHTTDILKKYDVIGMTITGAAMRLKILSNIRPCAAIVEEAAEVLEGQLISVLPPTLEHLVMIGDQEQLKPAVTCYQLKKYKNFDCSMFERLIKNHLVFQQLGTQCRMRGDIAALLRKLDIYENLQTNEEKTRDNDPPECIGKSMYFFNHTVPEKDIPGTNSKYNQEEINKILDVSKYLVKNNVPPKDITVLSAYRGQVQRMEKAFKASSDQTEQSFTKLEDIKITTIDSFQGEENKVILLSLVRSNRKLQIGFLAERNRICVAISRAKCALYFFGNATVYRKSPNWEVIIRYLEESKRFGCRFPLKDDHEKPHLDDGLEQILSQSSIKIIASKIPNKWDRLARLLNIEDSVVEGIHQLNSDAFPKAVKLLQKYRSSLTFDKSDLGHWLEWLDITLPVDVLPSESNNSDRLEEDEETVLNTTRLSPRERERLSLPIVGLWKRLASLLNITLEEVLNISLSSLYAEETQRAARMLALYNEKSNFSRKDLGRYLEEVECPILKEQVQSGILRKR